MIPNHETIHGWPVLVLFISAKQQVPILRRSTSRPSTALRKDGDKLLMPELKTRSAFTVSPAKAGAREKATGPRPSPARRRAGTPPHFAECVPGAISPVPRVRLRMHIGSAFCAGRLAPKVPGRAEPGNRNITAANAETLSQDVH